MKFGKYQHFSDLGDFAYMLSARKEMLRRGLKNLCSKETFARELAADPLPQVITAYSSNMIKRGPGVDPETQKNKAVNIAIAIKNLNGLIIRPGETFSFWILVGRATERKGYRVGRILRGSRLITGTGGGLCNLANTINYLVLHTPLTVTEFHTHSDALAPDSGARKPLANGTSVSYNSVDYRFKNNTDQPFQLLLWCDGDDLCGEIRAAHAIDVSYRLTEEGHHFAKEGEKYYRISKIYRETLDAGGQVLQKDLIVDNHSEVFFDTALIPPELLVGTDA